MKRARDVREQLLGLMDRVEVALVSNPGDHDAVRSLARSNPRTPAHNALLAQHHTPGSPASAGFVLTWYNERTLHGVYVLIGTCSVGTSTVCTHLFVP